MAGSKSNYLENALLNHVLGAVEFTPPPIIYVALSTAAFSEGASGSSFSELTGGSAARVAVANNPSNWPVTTTGQKVNGTTITFPAATTNWPQVLSFYLLDGLGAGANILYGGDLVVPRTLAIGDTASFGPGSMVFQED